MSEQINVFWRRLGTFEQTCPWIGEGSAVNSHTHPHSCYVTWRDVTLIRFKPIAIQRRLSKFTAPAFRAHNGIVQLLGTFACHEAGKVQNKTQKHTDSKIDECITRNGNEHIKLQRFRGKQRMLSILKPLLCSNYQCGSASWSNSSNELLSLMFCMPCY